MTGDGFQTTDQMRSWGRTPIGETAAAYPRFLDEIPRLLTAATADGMSCLAVGFGRSYGDSGLNLGQATISMVNLDRSIAFDPASGVLRAEAGMSLGSVIKLATPHGWFLPTTPGTRFVTLGGAVANDVHGKNHHRAGTFGCCIRRLALLRSDQGLVEIGPHDHPDLFKATIGGLGLTGIILWIEIQLVRIESTYLCSERIPFTTLAEFEALARESEALFEHTVAWVDCATASPKRVRGIYTRSNWSSDRRFDLHDDQTRLSLPIDLPGFALNPITLRAFNELYFHRQAAHPRRSSEHYTTTFYPLDAVGGWNRLYGARGFFQHQCVTPAEAGIEPIGEMLAAIAAAGEGSFLAVLKGFGSKASPGLMSFPQPGFTLALDFSNRGEQTRELLKRLDDIVSAAGGRLYPAKDGRMPSEIFSRGYPNLNRFKQALDPALSSSFWRRLNHD